MDKNCSAFREIGDNLIKQTLEQTSQNLSLTARILGIDRSTIYRRRKHNWQFFSIIFNQKIVKNLGIIFLKYSCISKCYVRQKMQ